MSSSSDPTSQRTAIAVLHRRAGLGLRPGELDARMAESKTAASEIDRLLSIGATRANDDPFAGVDHAMLGADKRTGEATAVAAWLDHMVASENPLGDRMTWLWHGHLVAGSDRVKNAELMARYIATLHKFALGNFRDLLRAVTTEAAMLIYLDGYKSTAKSPNENYSRELMELFALGLGTSGTLAYSEVDVANGARALTGFGGNKYSTEVKYSAQRHDDTSVPYLGHKVHDVDTVIDAVLAQPPCAPFVARRVANALLGSSVDSELVANAADKFRSSSYDISVLVAELLRGSLQTPATSFVSAPTPWLVRLHRATSATLAPKPRSAHLRAAGQVPFEPPNVSGWPSGNAWLAAGTVIERFNLAGLLASGTPQSSTLITAAAHSDWAALADGLGRPEGFIDAEISVLASRANVTERLTLAYASPSIVEI